MKIISFESEKLRRQHEEYMTDGVTFHSKTYEAVRFPAGNEPTIAGVVGIEIYAGTEPGFCVDFGNGEHRLITLTAEEARQLSINLWDSISG